METLDKCQADKISKKDLFKTCCEFKEGTRKSALKELIEETLFWDWKVVDRSLVRIT